MLLGVLAPVSSRVPFCDLSHPILAGVSIEPWCDVSIVHIALQIVLLMSASRADLSGAQRQ